MFRGIESTIELLPKLGIVRVLILTNILLWGAFSYSEANAGSPGSSFGNATCASSPAMCVDPYTQNGYFGIRVYRYYGAASTFQDRSESTIPYAMDSWSAATGPQFVTDGASATFTPYINLYMDEYPTNQPTDTPNLNALIGSAAIEVNMAYNGSSWYYCYADPCRVGFAKVYINRNKYDACSGGWSLGVMQYVQAHELGHTLGLDDVSSGNILMNNTWPSWCGPSNGGVNGPTSTEIGSSPACSASPKGIRCIYNWPW